MVNKILSLDCVKLYEEYKKPANETSKKRYMDPITADAKNITMEDKINSNASIKLLSMLSF